MNNPLSESEKKRRLAVYELNLTHRESAKRLGVTVTAYASWIYKQHLSRTHPLFCPKHHIRVRMFTRHHHQQRDKNIKRPSNYERGYVYCRMCDDEGSGWVRKELAVKNNEM